MFVSQMPFLQTSFLPEDNAGVPRWSRRRRLAQHVVTATSWSWKWDAALWFLCMVQSGQSNLNPGCSCMCLQPLPLILGRFTRGTKSEWDQPRVDCGRSLSKGQPVFLYPDWGTLVCRREKASGRMLWLVGYYCTESSGYIRTKTSEPGGGSKNISSTFDVNNEPTITS